jgi:hypothetical protein
MDWVGGSDWAQTDRHTPYSVSAIQEFLESLVRLVMVTGGRQRATSCSVVQPPVACQAIKRLWKDHLLPRGFIAPEALATVSVVATREVPATVAATPLDFTPDNVFFNPDIASELRFVDPWSQTTYLGNPGVCLGQFVTAANDVYRLPSGELLASFTSTTLDRLAQTLGVGIRSMRVGFALGRALQFSLSAFVRLDGDPKMARAFVAFAEAAMREAAEDA